MALKCQRRLHEMHEGYAGFPYNYAALQRIYKPRTETCREERDPSMAYAATHTQTAGASILSRLGNALLNSLVSIGEANHLVRQVEALQAMSDGAIAERDLKREDIVRHIFSSRDWM